MAGTLTESMKAQSAKILAGRQDPPAGQPPSYCRDVGPVVRRALRRLEEQQAAAEERFGHRRTTG